MPSVSSINSEEKATIKKAIKNSTNKILTATVVRLYVAYPNPDTWTYTNLMGAVVFVKDQEKNSFFFRLVDLTNNQGILWEQELYQDFKYNQECPFFHTFCTDDYFAAFSFASENDAKIFYKKVINREKLSAKKSQKNSKSGGGLFGKKNAKKGKIDKDSISKPTDFRHLGHIGFNPDTGFDVQNIDPSWKHLFDQLGELGISQEVIKQNADYIMQFVDEKGGINKVNKPTKTTTSKSAPGTAKKTPPPPPPSRRPGSTPPVKAKAKSPPPPPPPTRRSVVNNQSNNNVSLKQQSPPPSPKQAITTTLKQVTSHPPHKPVLPPPVQAAPPPPPVRPPTTQNEPPVQVAPPPPPPPVRPPTTQNEPSVQVAPPPPPPPVRPPTTQNEPPPLPPARVQTHAPSRQPTAPTSDGAPQPPPPPPASRVVPPPPASRVVPPPISGGVPPPPPPPPTSGGVPPPPPPPPTSGGVPPPPPPPPPTSGGAPPPPPPPPSNTTSTPPVTNGRANLLAEIRNVGGVSKAGLRPVGEPVRRSTVSEEPQSPTTGGNDLASALASALLNRGAAIRGDSDEDEDDDDDDWDD